MSVLRRDSVVGFDACRCASFLLFVCSMYDRKLNCDSNKTNRIMVFCVE